MEAGTSARGSRAVRLLMSVEHGVTTVSVSFASVLLAAAASVGFFQVLTRFVLMQPSTWSEPLVRTLLVWMAYLGLCGVIRAGALVSVDALYRACRGRTRRALEAIITLATLSLLLILAWFGTALAWRVRFQNLAGLEIPVIWAYAAIPVGAGVAVLAVLAHFFDPKREELESAV